jgi:hypothetical protein
LTDDSSLSVKCDIMGSELADFSDRYVHYEDEVVDQASTSAGPVSAIAGGPHEDADQVPCDNQDMEHHRLVYGFLESRLKVVRVEEEFHDEQSRLLCELLENEVHVHFAEVLALVTSLLSEKAADGLRQILSGEKSTAQATRDHCAMMRRRRAERQRVRHEHIEIYNI